MKTRKPSMSLPEAHVLTARPEGMKFDEYKRLRRAYNKQIRDRIKNGFLVHLSWRIDDVPDPQDPQHTTKIIRRFTPFVGDTADLLKAL